MRHIHTTATAVEKIRTEAKRTSRETGQQYHLALELLAVKAGYSNWKHVTVCAIESQRGSQSNLSQLLLIRQSALELIEKEDFCALLSGDYVSVHNSATGSTFALSAREERIQIDMTDELSKYVSKRVEAILVALGQQRALKEGDILVTGVELCLTMISPPISSEVSWSITRRSHVANLGHCSNLIEVL